MKTKYIFIDTWNGEGYSDSKAQILKFSGDKEAIETCLKYATEQCANSGSYTLEITKNHVGYSLHYGEQGADGFYEDEDNGAYHIVAYTGQYAVIINPMINTYRTIETEKEFNDLIASYIDEAGDEDHIKNLKAGNFNNCFDCLEEGDVIIQILEPQLKEEDLECLGSGDGVEYEIWGDKATGKVYNVPIEIVRNFNNLTEVK